MPPDPIPPPQPVAYVLPSQLIPRRRRQLDKRPQWSCAVLQICFGVLEIIFALISFAIHAALWQSGAGIWCGAFLIAAGALGIVSVKTEKMHHINACCGLSVLSMFFGGFVYFWMSVGSIDRNLNLGSYSVLYYTHYSSDETAYPFLSVAINSLALIVGFTVFVVSIVQIATCCRAGGCASCCRQYYETNQPTVVYIQQPLSASQNVMVPAFQPWINQRQ